MHEQEAGESRETPRRPRSSILIRLLAAFVVVSFIPIAVLAALSLQEAAAEPDVYVEGAESTDGTEAAMSPGHGTLFGIPIEYVELGVAGASVVLSVGAAVYVGRTIIRPIRSLEASMHRVETGDLDAEAEVASDDEIGHLAAAFNRMTGGLRREAMVRDLFGQYVSPEVARLAIERHGQPLADVVAPGRDRADHRRRRFPGNAAQLTREIRVRAGSDRRPATPRLHRETSGAFRTAGRSAASDARATRRSRPACRTD